MSLFDTFFAEHLEVTRRHFLRIGALSALATLPSTTEGAELSPKCAQACADALKKLQYLTPQEKFGNVSRGNPHPYKLPLEEKKKAGLTRETWKLEVIADTESKTVLENPLTLKKGNALDFAGLMKLAEKHAVSFPKIMTCNNIGAPLGMGIWEGVPLREVVWLTKPKKNVRRVHYHGFHNHDAKQMFQSSLPIGRVLEDPLGLPPVILCYKLNGQFLIGERGAPVRMVIPEAYGFKSVKWLKQVVITNLFHANDTYAKRNNDIDSWLKTFARALTVPQKVSPGKIIPVTGYAQVGISGLKRVQSWITPKSTKWPADDPYFTRAKWQDAELLPPPKKWGGNLPKDELPTHLMGFEKGKPKQWPMLLSLVHWAAALPGLPAGKYVLRSRSIDANGKAQPLPRPFLKSGRNSIEERDLFVE